MRDRAEASINERTRTALGACRFDMRTLLDLFMMLDKPFGLEYTGINSSINGCWGNRVSEGLNCMDTVGLDWTVKALT